MTRLILMVLTLSQALGSIPAFAQTYRFDCPTHCLHGCARKELVPGLYRGNCQISCERTCYRVRAEKQAQHGH